MKKYQIENYMRYKKDLELSMPEGLYWDEYSRDELIINFMPLVENLARKFATSYQAIGVLTINDLIQAGNMALVLAVDKLDWEKLNESQDAEHLFHTKWLDAENRAESWKRRYDNLLLNTQTSKEHK